MGSLALIAKQLGYRVTGCDANIYPPMSTQLLGQGIELVEGFDDKQLTLKPDLFIVGNVAKRGMPIIEAILNQRLPFTSGPAWLGEQVLGHKQVLAVAGTHGKTTTSSMLATILDKNGYCPSFLIGGIPTDFGVSARLSDSPYFVIEADEYDTAFFDKRSKFVHYRPDILVLNNLEFDHADIFSSLKDIEQQFQHVVRIVPNQGSLIVNQQDEALHRVLAQGVYSRIIYLGANAEWSVLALNEEASHFQVFHHHQLKAEVRWALVGKHNMQNALAALVAAHTIGISPGESAKALQDFKGVKRRLELKGQVRGVSIYDDFAHHPTAIHSTLAGLKAKVGQSARIIVVLEPRSNTMRMNVHGVQLCQALQQADYIFLYQDSNLSFHLEDIMQQSMISYEIIRETGLLVEKICQMAQPMDHIVVMSNGRFGNIHQQLLNRLS